MTTTIVRCRRCRQQVSNQHLYFDADHQLRPLATDALCDAHRFIKRWEDSPYNDRRTPYGCYNCNGETIDIEINYYLTTASGTTVNAGDHRLTLSREHDVSEWEHFEDMYRIEHEQDDVLEDVQWYLSHAIQSNPYFHALVEYPDDSHELAEISASDTVRDLLSTVRFRGLSAQCHDCGIAHDFGIV